MNVSEAEKSNILKWKGEKGFYEVYYIKFNSPETETACWIRYTLLSLTDGVVLPELWGIFFDAGDPGRKMAIKKTYSINEFAFEKERFYLQIGGAELFHNHAKGELRRGDDILKWDIQYEPSEKVFYHFPYNFMYTLPFPKTKVLSPNFDIKINGVLIVKGREIILKGAPGQQSHIWGRKHADFWVWANCNAFSGDKAILEGLSARIKLGGFMTPPLTLLYLRWKGKDFYMNGLRSLFLNKTDPSFPRWKFRGTSRGFSFSGEIYAEPESFVGVEYTDPDGEKLWCLNTKVADIKIEVYEGSRRVDVLRADKKCALEFVSRHKDGRVPVLI